MQPPKTGFIFLFYTPKKHLFKKNTFFNAYKVKKITKKNNVMTDESWIIELLIYLSI